MNEKQFLEKLQEQAKKQASLSGNSPLPEWVKPFASVIGLHYWQVLLFISCIVAVIISCLGFSSIVGFGHM